MNPVALAALAAVGIGVAIALSKPKPRDGGDVGDSPDPFGPPVSGGKAGLQGGFVIIEP